MEPILVFVVAAGSKEVSVSFASSSANDLILMYALQSLLVPEKEVTTNQTLRCSNL